MQLIFAKLPDPSGGKRFSMAGSYFVSDEQTRAVTKVDLVVSKVLHFDPSANFYAMTILLQLHLS